MNSFLNSAPGMIRNMMPPQIQNMMNIMQQAQQIKQNPNLLAQLLQKRGMINAQQVKDIERMGNNYEQIGQYLMQNGKMPTNLRPYEDQVSQVQNLMNGNTKEHQ